MKTLKYFGMMMLTVMMAFSMASCGSDKSDDNGGDSSGILGSWYIEATSAEYSFADVYYEIMTFKSNGELIVTGLFHVEGAWYKGSGSGTYKINGNKITSNIGGQSGTGTWSISGNSLTIDGVTFKKVDSKIQGYLDSAEIIPIDD